MEIRVANRNDVLKLKEVDAKDQYFVEELGEYHTVLDDEDFLNYFLEHDCIFIAEEDSRIIGFLIAQIKKWMFHHEKIIWIEHIVVDPEKRRTGVAYSMINYILNYFKKKIPDVRHVYSVINPDNKASLKMSEKFNPLSRSVFIISKQI